MLHQKNGGTPGNLSQFRQKKIIWQGHNVEYLLKYIAYIIILTYVSFSIDIYDFLCGMFTSLRMYI